MKKIVAVIFFLIVVSVGANVSAAERVFRSSHEMTNSSALFTDTVKGAQISVQGLVGDVTPMLDLFRAETENVSEYIDMSSYNITADSEDELQLILDDLYETLVFCSPRSYYLTCSDGAFSYWYYYDYLDYDDPDAGCILIAFSPVYDLDIYDGDYISYQMLDAVMPEIRNKQAFFDESIAQIQAAASDALSDFDYLLACHNYINLNYAYAIDEKENPSIRTHNNIMRMLEDKRSICQTFSMLYNYLLMERGMETAFVTSHYQDGGFEPYHTWNLVKLATAETDWLPYWYHIDLTWDNLKTAIENPSAQTDIIGDVRLTYFLLSDSKFRVSHNITVDGSDVRYYLNLNEYEFCTALDDEPWHNNTYYAESTYVIFNEDGSRAGYRTYSISGSDIKLEVPYNSNDNLIGFIKYTDQNGHKSFRMLDSCTMFNESVIDIDSGYAAWELFIWNDKMQPQCDVIRSPHS